MRLRAWVGKVFGNITLLQVKEPLGPSLSLFVLFCILEESCFEVVSGSLLLATCSSYLHHSSAEYLDHGIQFIFGLGDGCEESIRVMIVFLLL